MARDARARWLVGGIRVSDHIFMTEVVQPVLIKDGGLFLCCKSDGDVTTTCGSGLGLFYRDTRYLSRYELRLGGQPPLTLMSSAARGDQSVHELTNDDVEQLDGSPLQLQSVGARMERIVNGEGLTLTDRVYLRNFFGKPISVAVTVTLDALFEDIFELRGTVATRRGPTREVRVTGAGLAFRYHGADGVIRCLTVTFSRPPSFTRRGGARTATFEFRLASQARETLEIRFSVSETGAPARAQPPTPAFYAAITFESDNAILDRVMTRSLKDLAMLRTGMETNFLAGGMPWFVSPFGRDSILAALQTLVFDPRPAEGVARLFAHYQGRRDNTKTGEQPGKIPHELRLGAMAHLKEVTAQPSYMSVDSTPLFLILIGRHVEWSGSLALFEELRPAIDAALEWMAKQLASDPNGFLSYRGESAEGPINQGWKDSTSGVPRKNGGSPAPPIALCEVQGYAYLAQTLMAAAFLRASETSRAARLKKAAAGLRKRFNRDFWMESEGCYALALEKGKRQVTVVTSNAGQVLWSGIADATKAARTAKRLMASDMDCGWGIRTLSSLEKAYNPLNYHLGSVWPFDTGLIVAGFRRYRLDAQAVKLFDSVLAAADYFALGRLPEFYVGFQREAGLFPARCPFAEPMQAWSAGAIPYMLTCLLGAKSGPRGLMFKRPLLPSGTRRLAFGSLRIADAHVDCEITRGPSGTITANSRKSRKGSS